MSHVKPIVGISTHSFSKLRRHPRICAPLRTQEIFVQVISGTAAPVWKRGGEFVRARQKTCVFTGLLRRARFWKWQASWREVVRFDIPWGEPQGESEAAEFLHGTPTPASSTRSLHRALRILGHHASARAICALTIAIGVLRRALPINVEMPPASM